MAETTRARGLEAMALTRTRSRLNLRLLMWFLVFSLVPLLVTNAVGYQRSEVLIEHLVENYIAAIAQVQAQHVRDRIDHNLQMLEAITAGNDFLAAAAIRASGQDAGQMGTVASPAAVNGYLTRKLKELGIFESLQLSSLDGRIIAAAGRRDLLATKTIPQDPSSFSASVEGGPDSALPVFRFSEAVQPSGGPTVAFLQAAVGMDSARGFLQIPAQLAGHVDSFIIDDTGRPLYASHPHGPVTYSEPLRTPLISMPPGSSARFRDDDGVELIGTVTAINGFPWRYLAEVPANEALGDLRKLRDLSLLLELVFVGLLITTAWMVARDIVAPLHRLVDATRKVGRGDLSVRVSAREPDEIGELGRAFNEMTLALAETTERVHELHQREIERASQLATVGELASGVAHEIRNPVVSVSNGLDLVRRRVGVDATLEPIMEEMGRQLRRIQQTLHELLAFARPAAPALAPTYGNAVVQRAARLVQPAADRAGVVIDVRCGEANPHFLADEELLNQALVNVLMNAIEATPDHGHIDVTTHVEAREFVIAIADSGRGIADHDLENVFKPFFTTRHTGTGLGLPISRDIVQRHGGRLALQSRVGEGTIVTIHLPVRDTLEPPPTPTEPAP
jgi:two-component system NtrC family sensor kinase